MLKLVNTSAINVKVSGCGLEAIARAHVPPCATIQPHPVVVHLNPPPPPPLRCIPCESRRLPRTLLAFRMIERLCRCHGDSRPQFPRCCLSEQCEVAPLRKGHWTSAACQSEAMGTQTPSRHPALLIKRTPALETNREALTLWVFYLILEITSPPNRNLVKPPQRFLRQTNASGPRSLCLTFPYSSKQKLQPHAWVCPSGPPCAGFPRPSFQV